MAIVAATPVPRELLLNRPAGQNDDDGAVEEIVAGLVAERLLEERESGVVLAPAIREQVRTALDDDERRLSIQDAADRLSAVFPQDVLDLSMWRLSGSLADHVRAVVEAADELDVVTPALLRAILHRSGYIAYLGDLVSARDELQRAVELADARLPEEDTLRAMLRTSLGEVLNQLSRYAGATRWLRESLSLWEGVAEPDPDEVARARIQRGTAMTGLGLLDKAVDELTMTVEALAQRPSSRVCLALACKSLGWALFCKHDLDGAVGASERALALFVDACGPAHPETAGARTQLGAILHERGDREAGQTQMERAVEDLVATLSPEHPEIGIARSNLSDALGAAGDLKGAQEQLELSLASAGRTLPEDYLGLGIRHGKLAWTLTKLGDLRGALAHREEALSVLERAVGLDDPKAVEALAALAGARRATGDLPGARTAYERALATGQRSDLEQKLPLSAYSRQLASVLRQLGDLPGALRSYQQARVLSRPDDDDAITWNAIDRLSIAGNARVLQEATAHAYQSLGMEQHAQTARAAADDVSRAILEEAIATDEPAPLLEAGGWAVEAGWVDVAVRAAERMTTLALTADFERWDYRGRLTDLWHRIGRAAVRLTMPDQALHAFERRLTLLQSQPQPDPQQIGVTLHDLADVRAQAGELSAAIALYEEAAASKREGSAPADLATTLFALGRGLMDAERNEEAEVALTERLALLRRLPDPEPLILGVTLSDLSVLNRRMGRFEESLTLSRQAVEQMRRSGDRGQLAIALQWHGRALASCARPAEAQAAYEEGLELLRDRSEPDPQSIGVMLHDLARVHRDDGRTDVAIRLYREAVESKRRADRPRDLAVTLMALGRALEGNEQYEEAVETFEQRLLLLRGLSDPDLEAVAETLEMLADVRGRQRRVADAAEYYRQAADAYRRMLQGDWTSAAPDVPARLIGVAVSQLLLGEQVSAAATAATAASALEDVEQSRDLSFALTLQAQASVDEPATALGLLRRARHTTGQWRDADQLEAVQIDAMIADVCRQLGQLEAANELLAQATAFLDEIADEVLAAPDPTELIRLSTACLNIGALDVAQRALASAADAIKEGPAVALSQLGELLTYLALRCEAAEDFVAAAAAIERCLELPPGQDGREVVDRPEMLERLGHAHEAIGELESAIDLFRQSAALLAERGEGDEADALFYLGRALAQNGDDEAGLHMLERHLKGLQRLPLRNADDESCAWHAIGLVQSRLGRNDEALAAHRHAIDLARDGDAGMWSIAASLSMYAQTGLGVVQPEQLCELADEAAGLLRRAWLGAEPVGKERSFRALPEQWPVNLAEIEVIARAVGELSSRAVALLVRVHRLGVVVETVGGDAATELGAAGLLTEDPPEGPLQLSAAGVAAAGLLGSAGAAPAAVAAWLRIASSAPDVGAVSSATLIARLACSPLVSAAALVEGLPPVADNAVVDTAEELAALTLRALCVQERDRAEGAALRARALAAVAALPGDGDAQMLVTAGLTCLDLGEVDQAQTLLVSAAAHDDVGASGHEAAEIGLAWYRLAASLEADGRVNDALVAYERSVAILADASIPACRAVVGVYTDLLYAQGARERAAVVRDTYRLGRPQKPRTSRISWLLQLSRTQTALGQTLHARASSAQAATEMRLVALVRSGERGDDAAGAPGGPGGSRSEHPTALAVDLSRLNPLAVALLERLRQDLLLSTSKRLAPGLPVPPEQAWSWLCAIEPLKQVGFVMSDLPLGWFTLTARGRAAAALLGPPDDSATLPPAP
ncbi:tetratricopeptide repeat protein [Conexibacter stalactiti]|uniref:Tetratricopeptide repeat protein n=1 Tax=Conexibacter stalactiti TaxID=1940611 RepID=A0ABU4HR60_9ACTN|nr:tetratricopeptide repeat protein [Conexibacter stalactiti]MDW5595780.1 tetratricopeptide repeat protein [Conexibacter stalactiti]MEC5036422.1 tetratricopeptide repeat protein [Conexibacter stalactiti]